jgi:hypothetical protein
MIGRERLPLLPDPYRDSDAHDFSAEGARPVTVVEFLIEVQELVEEAGLL